MAIADWHLDYTNKSFLREDIQTSEHFETSKQDLRKPGKYFTKSLNVFVTNDGSTPDIAFHITDNPYVSTRILSRELGISQSSVSRMVRECNYHPYHMQLMRELTERDFPKRMRFWPMGCR